MQEMRKTWFQPLRVESPGEISRKISWRRKWQPTLVFLPEKSHGQKSLRGYITCNCKESNTSEHYSLLKYFSIIIMLGFFKIGELQSTAFWTILLVKVELPRCRSGKESICQFRSHRFHPWVGKNLWRRNWQPLQCSFLENPMDRGTWWATVHGVIKVRHDWESEHAWLN